MNIDEQTYLEISSYLNNEMTPDIKEAFEKRLQTDKELAENVALFRRMNAVFNEEGWNFDIDLDDDEVRQLTDDFKSEDTLSVSNAIKNAQKKFENRSLKRKPNVRPFTILSITAIAASIVLGYFLFFNEASPSKLYQDHHDWSSLPSLTTKDVSQITLIDALQLFDDKKYEEALLLFRSIKDSSNVYDPKIELYIGVSELELDQYAKALTTFDTLLNSATIDSHKALWYKSLVYLKQDNKDMAVQTLEELVSNEKNYNYKKAKKVLNKLK